MLMQLFIPSHAPGAKVRARAIAQGPRRLGTARISIRAGKIVSPQARLRAGRDSLRRPASRRSAPCAAGRGRARAQSSAPIAAPRASSKRLLGRAIALLRGGGEALAQDARQRREARGAPCVRERVHHRDGDLLATEVGAQGVPGQPERQREGAAQREEVGALVDLAARAPFRGHQGVQAGDAAAAPSTIGIARSKPARRGSSTVEARAAHARHAPSHGGSPGRAAHAGRRRIRAAGAARDRC